MRDARELLTDTPNLLEAMRFPWLQQFMIRKLFWVLSEGPGGPSWRHKYYEVAYRSPSAHQSPDAKGLRHEHVLPLKAAVDAVVEDPSRALEVADQITICVVTSDEAKRLDRSTALGWDRYRDARVPVMDVSKQADDPEYWIVRPDSF